MRTLLTLLASAIVISVLLLVGVQLASAGTPDAPELTDVAGDCAVPYGNEYLDLAAAWVDNEDADSFDVHLRLAAWRAELAEGSGYAVQFSHQGVTWGIVAVYSSVIAEGWSFSTGVATAELAEGFEDAPGSFDAATSTMVVTFAKGIFPHRDATDTTLRDFVAMSADLRPAYPFFVGEDAGLDGNGRWIVCDDAVGTGTYTFAAGAHSSAHTTHDAATLEGATAENATGEPDASGAAPVAQPEENDTPLAPLVAIGALVLAAARRR